MSTNEGITFPNAKGETEFQPSRIERYQPKDIHNTPLSLRVRYFDSNHLSHADQVSFME